MSGTNIQSNQPDINQARLDDLAKLEKEATLAPIKKLGAAAVEYAKDGLSVAEQEALITTAQMFLDANAPLLPEPDLKALKDFIETLQKYPVEVQESAPGAPVKVAGAKVTEGGVNPYMQPSIWVRLAPLLTELSEVMLQCMIKDSKQERTFAQAYFENMKAAAQLMAEIGKNKQALCEEDAKMAKVQETMAIASCIVSALQAGFAIGAAAYAIKSANTDNPYPKGIQDKLAAEPPVPLTPEEKAAMAPIDAARAKAMNDKMTTFNAVISPLFAAFGKIGEITGAAAQAGIYLEKGKLELLQGELEKYKQIIQATADLLLSSKGKSADDVKKIEDQLNALYAKLEEIFKVPSAQGSA